MLQSWSSGLKAPVINLVRNQPTNIRMHSVGLRKKHSEVCGDGCMVLQKILQDRLTALVRMAALSWLAKLHLVTHQYNVLGAPTHANQIGNGNLTGFINEQVIKLLRALIFG